MKPTALVKPSGLRPTGFTNCNHSASALSVPNALTLNTHKLAKAVYYILRDGKEYLEELLFGA